VNSLDLTSRSAESHDKEVDDDKQQQSPYQGGNRGLQMCWQVFPSLRLYPRTRGNFLGHLSCVPNSSEPESNWIDFGHTIWLVESLAIPRFRPSLVNIVTATRRVMNSPVFGTSAGPLR